MSDAPGNVIELQGVCKQYGSKPAVHAMVDVDFCVRQGEWVSVTGPSGAGKSTLLNVIGCLDHPSSGKFYLDGVDTSKLTDDQRAGLRSHRIGFVFQSFHLLPYRSVVENVMMAQVYHREPAEKRRKAALKALKRVGLSHRAHFYPTQLSGGERQRVAIARALLGSPSLLLCDEPTGNLDTQSSETILKLLEELNRDGLTLIIVTHNEEIANRSARRVHIVDGRLSEKHSKGPAPRPQGNFANSSLLRRCESGISFQDLLQEAIAGMFSRPGRMGLTVLGIVIGLTALVATLGLTRTAGNRIISQFDQVSATELFITAKPGRTTGIVDPKALPWDAPERLRRLNGVVAAGTMSEVNVGEGLVSSSPIRDPSRQTAFKMSVYAASPELFRAVRATMRTGRTHDAGHSARADRIAVLGPDAASRLGAINLEQLPAIAIGDELYLVAGIIDDVARRPELLGAVIIPEGTARREFGLAGPGRVVVETKIGAAYLIAEQAPLALRPDDPASLKIEVPQEPRRLREEVQSDLSMLFLLLGGLSLIVGAIGIANITLVGVMERTGEIGLRRAIGATRQHIAAQFLVESASIGVIGGIIGASMGVLVVVGVSAYQVWTPVLDLEVPLAAPLVGGIIGLLSGTYPALRASKLEPVDALRS